MNRYNDYDPMKVIRPIMAGYGLYQGIRDDNRRIKNEDAATEVQADFAQAQSPDDVQFIQQTAHRYGVNNPDTMERVQKRGDDLLLQFAKSAADKNMQPAVTEYQQIMKDNPDLPPGAVAARLSPENLTNLLTGSKGNFDDIQRGLAQGVKDFRAEKERLVNLQQFAKAQDVAASYLQPNQGSQQRGQYQPAPQIRADVAAHLSDFALTDPQRNSINTMLDKGMEDVWQNGRNVYTGKADGEVLAAQRAEQSDARQQKYIDAAAQRQEKYLTAAEQRQQRSITAAEERANRRLNGPNKILPASQLESLADMKQVKDVLGEASTLLQTKNISTGPVAGRMQSVGAAIGMANDDFVNMQQKLQTAQNIMLKLRSGAAVTESEYKRFLKEYPTPNDPKNTFVRRAQNAISYANQLMDEKISVFEEGGYRVPKKSVATKDQPRFKILEVK